MHTTDSPEETFALLMQLSPVTTKEVSSKETKVLRTFELLRRGRHLVMAQTETLQVEALISILEKQLDVIFNVLIELKDSLCEY